MALDLLRDILQGVFVLVQGGLAVVELRFLLSDRGLVALLGVLHLLKLRLEDLFFLCVFLRHLLEILLPIGQLIHGGRVFIVLGLGELQLGVGLFRCRRDAFHRGLELVRPLRC